VIALDSRPVRSDGILSQANAESLILLKPDDGQYFTLDEVGARVWQLCDGSRAVTDVISTIYAEYDAPLAAIQADVVELMDDLAREKLLAPS
jgi:coenzyme PQQ synthesis protein D (PqqD)